MFFTIDYEFTVSLLDEEDDEMALENETARDRELLRRAHDWNVIGNGHEQIHLLVSRLREIEQIAKDPAFASDAMGWVLALARRPLDEPLDARVGWIRQLEKQPAPDPEFQQKAMEAYERGEYQTSEEVLAEIKGKSSETA